MDEDIENSGFLKYVIKCSRRLGKTYYLVCRGITRCIKQPGALVRFAAPTQGALTTIIKPIMRKIIHDCPLSILPRWSTQESAYIFNQESRMYLSGVNQGHGEKLRGNYCDEFIIDEAGTVTDLEYLVADIAMPQLLDMDGKVIRGRRLIISGSPAKTPAHEFTRVGRVAYAKGNYSHFTIYDGGYSEDIIDIFKEEAGGEESSTWKREYLAQDVVDEKKALVKEWKADYIQPPLIDEYFKFYYKYDALDIGVRDKTVCLYAHYDFKRATLFVHGETVLSGPDMTTERLAEEVKEKEKYLFGEYEVRKRISDIDLLLINDLSKLHQLYFSPTNKGKLEEMINEVRIWVGAGRVIVDPSCKQLIGCLAYGIWDKNRKDFERVDEYGHFDAMAALMYLIRNVDHRVNPIPEFYGRPSQDHWQPTPKQKSNAEKLRQAFNVKRGRRY